MDGDYVEWEICTEMFEPLASHFHSSLKMTVSKNQQSILSMLVKKGNHKPVFHDCTAVVHFTFAYTMLPVFKVQFQYIS